MMKVVDREYHSVNDDTDDIYDRAADNDKMAMMIIVTRRTYTDYMQYKCEGQRKLLEQLCTIRERKLGTLWIAIHKVPFLIHIVNPQSQIIVKTQ